MHNPEQSEPQKEAFSAERSQQVFDALSLSALKRARLELLPYAEHFAVQVVLKAVDAELKSMEHMEPNRKDGKRAGAEVR
jgi:hypothetical protein